MFKMLGQIISTMITVCTVAEYAQICGLFEFFVGALVGFILSKIVILYVTYNEERIKELEKIVGSETDSHD